MKIRIIIATGVMALASIGVVGASSATASSDVPNRECAATGTTSVSPGLGLPTAPKTNVSFSISATCAGTDLAVSASGTLSTASCGRSVGSGTITIGGQSRPFDIQTAGGTFVLTGGATGGGQVVADPTVANNSCAAGTAHLFRTTGVVNF